MERISDERLAELEAHYKRSLEAGSSGIQLPIYEFAELLEAYRTPTGLDVKALAFELLADREGPTRARELFRDFPSRVEAEVARTKDALRRAALGAVASPHWHCVAGCDHAAGQMKDGVLVCAFCGAPFKECTPETCPPVVASPEGNSAAASLPVSEQTVPEPAGDIASEGVRRWDEATGSFVYDYADSVLPSASPPEPEAKTGGAQSLDKWAALMAQASELSEKIDAELHAPSPAPAVGVDGWRWVPIEPAREMRAAAYPIIEASATERALHTWRAMLSAAPASLPAGTLRVTPDTLNAAVRAVSRLPTDTVMCEPSKVVDAVLAALSTSPLAKGDG